MRRSLLLVLLAACGPDDKTDACDLSSTTTSMVQVQDRKAIGLAAPYAPDLGLAARDEELRTSITARRQAAWAAVEKVLAPTPLGDPRLADSFGSQPAIPAWGTWYGKDDFARVFKKLYRDLGPAGRRARSPIDPAAGLAWGVNALDELPEWPEQRYLDYLATIDTQVEANGLGGASRVGYSTGAISHLLNSYAKQYACRSGADPDPFDASAVRTGQPVTQSDAMELAKCDWKLLGPFQAGDGEVVVTSAGDGDVDLYVRRGEAPDPSSYDCKASGDTSDERCTVDGGGPVYVAVFGAAASAVTIDVAYVAEDVLEPACLDGEMPRDAVVVKADWRRQLAIGELMSLYLTSGARMETRFASDSTWVADGSASPGPSAIYTVTTSLGQTFRLPGLHIMSKELDHWMWITLWWSADPDSDFGADRPASIAALGPWRNYKMCVTTQYLEGDPDPRGGFSGSLGDAIAAVHGGVGAPSWCSNPYLENGTGNAATNCIGCHQHGGTALRPEEILANKPHFGTTRIRNNFFTDYLWVIKGGAGEELSAVVQDEVDYWDASDP
ncbi:MAG TPA: PPC domain-containing protein [Kofleriaceae bacterium]|nr:PPC domain-containing protein [Kofleriaceae bacterium]